MSKFRKFLNHGDVYYDCGDSNCEDCNKTRLLNGTSVTIINLHEIKKVYEWDFKEPSDEVNLEKIETELNNIPLIYGKLYLNELRKKAPIVFSRLVKLAKENNRMPYLEELKKEIENEKT